MDDQDAGLPSGRLPMPPFGALRAFEAYGRAGGVRRAAEVLGVSHTIVSRHLRALEDWVGTGLIDRATGTLTASGRAYHQDITVALRALSRASVQFMPKDEGPTRVTCVSGMAQAWLAGRLSAFRARYPGQELVLRPLDRLPDFDHDAITADIRYVRQEGLGLLPDDLTILEIARPPMFPVASPAVAAEVTGRIRCAADLMTEGLLTAEDNHEWRNFFVQHQVPTPSFQSSGSLGHASLTLAAARHGQGVALANVYLTYDDLVKGHLVPIFAPDIKYEEITMGAYFLVAPVTHWRRPGFIAFRNWLLQEISAFDRLCASTLHLPHGIRLSPRVVRRGG
ncbi:LysR family transcriptional regulator [Ameyamaea chiangmaiensis NBRC 103196]|uniref:LysR family transcriptional regulator n=1 Tax=Ameyamaea chiangmaiensis TaxID=442969 RepID=A0A850PCH6_9PROT|nr:LysR substrate-binding domain-containing protein [Ameyamaea chiangmaiensis]MBS4074737.1 LysR family transcriptional regulator [Ameyamaea chiangmaiensis]NVN40220.1 LysR family transcriptional regulator [Ameyamaea chiangmaiensis]GBQ62558.1 LysR family transcriptional regulator [Ameyamaea chiangmaiensis NBRC 103196]